MDLKLKIAVAVIPYLVGGGVAFSLGMPAWSDYQTKVQAVDDKKKEQEDLQAKLSNKTRIQKEKKDLNDQIESLRSSVPRSPDMDLFTIDVEKMCNESNCELVGIKQADAETLRKAGITIEEPKKDDKKDKNKKASAPPDAGLAKMSMSVRVIGDYSNLMDLVRKLESYQRVVQISELKTHVPKYEKNAQGKIGLPDDSLPGEGEPQGDYHKLPCTLLVTAYYLP